MAKTSKPQRPTNGRKMQPVLRSKVTTTRKALTTQSTDVRSTAVNKSKFGAYSFPLRETLMVRISKIFDQRGWTQTQAAEYLGVTQPRISDLTRARTENFTIDLLVDWLGALGQTVSIESKESRNAPHSVLQRYNISEESIPYYTKAITVDPLTAINYVKRGDAYFAQSKYDLSVGDYTRAMELEPGRPDWRLRRADAYIKLEQYKASVFDCQNVLKQLQANQFPAFDGITSDSEMTRIMQEITWWSYLCLGRALASSESEDEALAAFESAIDTAPQFGRSYFERGRLFEKREQFQQALEDYARACQCDPTDVPSNDHLAALRRKLLKDQHQEQRTRDLVVDAEVDSLTQSIDTAHTPALKAVFHRKRAEIYHKRGDYALAIADFTRAIELDPQQNWLWSNITYARFMTGDYAGTISDCDKVINSDMDVVHRSGAYMYRGWACEKLDMPEQARECYDQGILLNPKDAPLIWARGILLESMGEKEAALADYRQTLYVCASTPGNSHQFVEQVKTYIDNLEGKEPRVDPFAPTVDTRDTEYIVYDRLSPSAERVFHYANEATLSMGHDCLCTEYLLLGLLRTNNTIAAVQLEKIGLRVSDVLGAIEVILGQREPIKRSGRFTVNVTHRLRHVLQLALDYSLRRGDKEITSEHLLLGLVLEILECRELEKQGNAPAGDDLYGIAASLIMDLKVDIDKLKDDIIEASWG